MSATAAGGPSDPRAAAPRTGSSWAGEWFNHPRHGPLPALLLGLTVATGVVDAVSILALGRVFIANMTGNIVFIGFALAGAPGFSLAASLLALAGFLLGAAAGGPLVTRFRASRGRLLAVVTTTELVLLAAAVVIAALSRQPFAAVPRNLVVLVAATALGLQNAAARALAVPDATTTVLTMTLTGLAADLRQRNGRVIVRRLLAVGAMLGLDRWKIFEATKSTAGLALADDMACAPNNRSVHIIAGVGGFAWFQLLWPHNDVAAANNPAFAFHAPGQQTMASGSDHPLTLGPQAPWRTLGQSKFVSCYMSGQNQTHTASPASSDGERHWSTFSETWILCQVRLRFTPCQGRHPSLTNFFRQAEVQPRVQSEAWCEGPRAKFRKSESVIPWSPVLVPWSSLGPAAQEAHTF